MDKFWQAEVGKSIPRRVWRKATDSPSGTKRRRPPVAPAARAPAWAGPAPALLVRAAADTRPPPRAETRGERRAAASPGRHFGLGVWAEARGTTRWPPLAEGVPCDDEGSREKAADGAGLRRKLLSGQPEPPRWSRVGAPPGTGASDAGGARGSAAAGARRAGPGGPHVRAVGAAGDPGARGAVCGKPPPAAGNGGGPAAFAGAGRVGGAGSGRVRGGAGRGAAPRPGSYWGRFPAVPASKHVNKAWRCVSDPAAPRTASVPSAGAGDRRCRARALRALPGVDCARACSWRSEGR
ncbi:translation initiation factor IF-2-like [Equus quagga]|uniref:translation initiation factor IF-2-like n=1 Tax=Equus quagga TaxID=89248 RepID=UPI001EE29F9A|nr:translation initiation factor IF-2-like [Equus quagga]